MQIKKRNLKIVCIFAPYTIFVSAKNQQFLNLHQQLTNLQQQPEKLTIAKVIRLKGIKNLFFLIVGSSGVNLRRGGSL